MSNGWVRINFSARSDTARHGRVPAAGTAAPAGRCAGGPAPRRQVLRGHLAELSDRVDRVDKKVLGVGEMLDQRREFGQHPIQDVGPAAHVGQQPVGGVDGMGDVVALLVQLAVKVSSLPRKSRICVGPAVSGCARPRSAATSRFGTPPPRKTMARLASVCSVVG